MSQCWPRPRPDSTWGSLSANDTQIWSRGPWSVASRLMAFPWVKSSDHTRKPTDLPRSAAAARRRRRPAFPSDVFVLSPVNPNSDVRQPATCSASVRPPLNGRCAMPLPSLTVCVCPRGFLTSSGSPSLLPLFGEVSGLQEQEESQRVHWWRGGREGGFLEQTGRPHSVIS